MVRPLKGVVTDNHPVDQPPDTYRFALNAVSETTSGNTSFKSRERGTVLCESLPAGYIPLGKVYKTDDVVYVFSTNGISSELGVVDNCTYTQIFNIPCLGFQNPIDAVYRVRLGCEDVLYWTEKGNPVRYFNISRPQDFKSGNEWDCEKFKLFRDYTHPCIVSAEEITGGTLKSGAYSFAIQYLDEDFNPTNWITVTDHVNIYKDFRTTPYNDIHGSISDTNKAIRLTVSNLDDRFPYYRIAVLSATSNTGDITTILASPTIQTTQTVYIVDGGTSGWTPVSVEEIRQPKIDVHSAEHIEQLEGRLILAGISGRQVNYCDFQQYASKICTNYVIDEVDESQYNAGDPVTPETPFNRRSFQRDEIVEVGIVYVWKDGNESPVFHIPGRGLNQPACNVTGTTPIFRTDKCAVIDAVIGSEQNCPYADILYTLRVNGVDITSTIRITETGIVDVYCGAETDTIEWISAQVTTGSSCLDFDVYVEIRQVVIGYETTTDCTPTGIDTQVLTTWSDDFLPFFPAGAVAYNALPSNQKLKRWQVYNTAYEGRTGYYQCSTATYDDRKNCDGSSYWGKDSCGFDLAGTPIRHHKMPDASIEPVHSNGKIRVLGLEFDNIEYPHPDIVGHYFVFGERGLQNRQVIENGVMGNMRTCDDITAYSFIDSPSNYQGWNYQWTPRLLYDNTLLTGDYHKINGTHTSVVPPNNSPGNDAFKMISGLNKDVFHIERMYTFGDLTPIVSHYIPEEEVYLNPLSIQNIATEPVHNLSHSNPIKVVKKDGLGLPVRKLYNVTVKTARDVGCNLDSITYYKGHNCMKTLEDSQEVFGGDVYISNFKVTDIKFFAAKSGWIDEVLSIVAIMAAFAITVLTGGLGTPLLIAATALAALGIAAQYVAIIFENYRQGRYDCHLGEGDIEFVLKSDFPVLENYDGYAAYLTEYMRGIWIESEINMGLRYYDLTEGCQYEPYPDAGLITDYVAPKIFDTDTDGERIVRGLTCPEIYRYNKDYSRMEKEKPYFHIGLGYDCCSACTEYFPNRVHWSVQSFQEERSDNYRIFLANDYRDIEAHKGLITDTFRKNEDFFVHTSEGLWQVPKNVQERVTDGVVSFLGTGGFFGIPPRLVMDAEVGSMGNQHKWSSIGTRYGRAWVDERESRIYLMSDGLDELTLQGNRNWFENNLKSHLNTEFRLATGFDYPYRDFAQRGIGIQSTYDPRHKRLIFTKIDYKFLKPFKGVYTGQKQAGIYWDGNNFVEVRNTVAYSISFDNEDLFENKSWTMSYSLIDKAWTGWHSYMPKFYIETANDFYSMPANEIWRHNVGQPCRFYNTRFPHIIEFIVVGETISTLMDIKLSADATLNNIDQYWKTFNKIWVYTTSQSSGELRLTPKTAGAQDYLEQQTINNLGVVPIDRVERVWTLSGVSDYLTSGAVSTSDWSFTRGMYFIDKLPVNIDFDKDWWTVGQLRDKWFAIRLIMDSPEDYNLTTMFLDATLIPSER